MYIDQQTQDYLSNQGDTIASAIANPDKYDLYSISNSSMPLWKINLRLIFLISKATLNGILYSKGKEYAMIYEDILETNKEYKKVKKKIPISEIEYDFINNLGT